MVAARMVAALLVMLSAGATAYAQQRPVDNGTNSTASASASVPVPALVRVDARLHVEIPAQPLDDALQEYSRLTGWSLLYDAREVSGRRSAAVRGEFTAREAIERLVAGSGMAVRFTSSDALLLVPMASLNDFHGGTAAGNDVPAGARAAYYAWLQARVTQGLCGDPLTTPGRYRVALRFDIGPVGTIEDLQVHVSGHPEVAARVRARLAGLPIGRKAPPDLGMPVTMIVMQGPDDGGCGS